MPVAFARLRIAGFKSFAEPVALDILPGLTGIVGPNGCGKSNVVEALRWAMGESSARSLRGAEMDDVIFAGTAHRPSRNLAEVTLALEATAGRLPPPLHEQDSLEISRRVERGVGSVYRVNGRELRARDVQTLFADLASGARASAMVSQGRIGALVGARPEERRAILEEAAGITGLHARRHEAELKLRAAEANLARAEDLRGQLETQLEALRRQARQTARFRNLSGAIRAAEAELLAIERTVTMAAREAAAAALQVAGTRAADATVAATEAAAAATEAAALLPKLRSAEAESRTALERHRIADEQLAAEAERGRVALAEAAERVTQIARDLAHAETLRRDAEAALVRLQTEADALETAAAAHPARAEAAEAAAREAEDAARAAEAVANRATEHAAELAARARTLGETLAGAEARHRRLAESLARLAAERARVRVVAPASLAAATAEASEAGSALEAARLVLETAERARGDTAMAHQAARRRESEVKAVRAGFAAETQALAELLAVSDAEQWPRMVDALDVPAGLEAALGAALGEELESAADPEAARHWRVLPPLEPPPALPDCATPLADLVAAPAALARALAGIGLIADEAAGAAAQAWLAPGQALVARDGALWRWDGYTIRANTPTQAAVRLTQRNRLAALRRQLQGAEGDAAEAVAARAATEAAEREAIAAERAARAARGEAEQRRERARAAAAALTAEAAAAAARLAALDEQGARLLAEQDEAAATLAAARAAHAALPDAAAARQEVEAARAALSLSRRREAETGAARESLARQAAALAARRGPLAAERDDWRLRATDAAGRIADLAARRDEATAAHEALQAAPAAIAARRAAALDALETAEAAHRAAADALVAAETESGRAERTARAAEAALATAREAVVRAEGEMAQAVETALRMAERIRERLGAGAALPDPPAEPPPGPEAEARARKRLERLLREREEMGPVNLRADIEAAEIEARISAITTERDELATAIAKLRGSIGHLNREGRERLAAVFEQVDRNFQALFGRLFGGGRAHLALVGSDDPLLAGLEIYAQPPGKKLASLSLLSGGEQALTALALIFAVFRCNPAPLCVLDEVDAPLDDANVERFCALLDEMVRDTGTRFLVVTHHHLTMARMDRLYGVTMQERGVSRLLSVDLSAAAELADPPRIAAE